MSEETQVVSDKTFTQAELDNIIQERLSRQNAVHQNELAAARAQTPSGLSEAAEAELARLRSSDAAMDSTTASLAKLFGRGSSGKEANSLCLSNRPLYDSLRREAVKRGLLR
jgi:hypothetical protein